MHQNLVIKAFEKAGNKIQRKEPYPIAQELVSFISEKTKETYTSRSLVNKYNAAIQENLQVRLKGFVVDALCLYLEYPNFEAFDNENPTKRTVWNWVERNRLKCWFKFLVYHLFLLILGISIYLYATRQRWMIWEENHYVEVQFDKKYGTRLKLFKQERIDDFKRIEVDCSTPFFNPDGSPIVWYGRNQEGELQYFTDLALHPETGKTLKKISNYMINTHVCPKSD